MSDWPKRPEVGGPVIWESYSARPADPRRGDVWETPRGRWIWEGEWVPEGEWVTLESEPPGTGFPQDVTLESRL